MSWFDEQLKYRQEKDDEKFSGSLLSVAGAVMGKRLTEALGKDEIAQSAIEEILKHYRCGIPQDEIPPALNTLEEQLEYRMRPFGIMRRNVVLDRGWYRNAVGAMLGTLKSDGSAVALIPSRFSGYYYVDLATGKHVKINRRTEKLIDGEATAFYKPLPLRAINLRDIIVFMMDQFSVSDILTYVGMAALISLVGLLSPMFTKWLLGDVLESGKVSVLLALSGFMLGYAICRTLFTIYRSLFGARLNTKQSIAIQAAAMSRIMNLPVPFFKEYSAGELMQRSNHMQSIGTSLMNSIGDIGITSLFSLIYIGQIFGYAPALVAPSLIIILTTVTLGLIVTLVQMKVTKKTMLAAAKTSGITYSTISGIQKIKLAGAEKRMFSRWAKTYSQEARLLYNPPTFLKLGKTILLAVSLFGTHVLYKLAISNGVSVADYYAFTTAYGAVSGAFTSLVSIATVVANIKPAVDMAKPIMDALPELADGKEVVTELKGNIELSNVSFRYSDDMPNVIDNLSLRIKAGEYLAIVGSTGCGKSTLLRLLLGFEKPQKGAIYYDRKDIARIDLKSLRRRIGTVMQDGKLFLDDIYSNIVISAPSLTLDEAWEAAETASIADDIRAMPMGMNTIISEGQGGISGGQKQRLMIARAIAPKPKILMFDEATSALDNITQKKVTEAIDKLKCTRIVIAHRLSTIRHADRIIFLSGGSIVEDGTYDELIAKNGYFADLVKRQRLDIDD